MKRKNTIADIAKCAGVSKTTVSRYINGKYHYMSEDTRARIRNIIEVTDFKPNNLARSLKSQKSNLIGLVIADIENPFSASIIKGATDTLHQAGYNLMIASSNNSYQKEKQYIDSFISQSVDGLIVNTAMYENDYLISLANSGMPVVLADRHVKDYDFDIVYIENKKSVRMAMEHLKEQKYNDIALFTEDFTQNSTRIERRDVFLEVLKENGITAPEKNVYVVKKDSLGSIREALRDVIERTNGTPAVIVANESLLRLTVNAAVELDVQTPNDFALCGYDDWGWLPGILWPSALTPRITTVTAHAHNLGEMTAELLLRRLSQPDEKKVHMPIRTQLIVRESTKHIE